MADEYISREAVLKAFKLIAKNPNKDYQRGMQDTIDCLVPEVIADIPTADVQPVKRGKWEKKKGYLVCSNCGMTVDTIGYTYEEQEEVFRYCSCCGYRMDGDAE